MEYISFNYDKFKRYSELYNKISFEVERPSNGMTFEDRSRLESRTWSHEDHMGAFLCMPLPNYGFNKRAYYGETASVTVKELSKSGLKIITIYPSGGTTHSRREAIIFEIPTSNYSIFRTHIDLFDRPRGSSLTADIDRFDKVFTNSYKQEDISFQGHFFCYDFIQSAAEIEKSAALGIEVDFQDAVKEKVLSPIVEKIIAANVSKVHKDNVASAFFAGIIGKITNLNSSQLENLKTRFLQSVKVQGFYSKEEVEEIREQVIDTNSLKEQIKLFLVKSFITERSDVISSLIRENPDLGSSVVSNNEHRSIMDLIGLDFYLAREQRLRYFGSNLRIDFGCSFCCPYETSQHIIRFPRMNSTNITQLEMATTCLIEVKTEKTRALSIIQELLNHQIVSKTRYQSGQLRNTIIRKALELYRSENIKPIKAIDIGELRTLVADHAEESSTEDSLRSDLNAINTFISENLLALQNLALSLNKLIIEALATNCDHVILTDYFRYLFIYITGDEIEAELAGTIPSEVPFAYKIDESELSIQSFYIDSRDVDDFRFKVLSFLLHSIQRYDNDDIWANLSREELISQRNRSILIRNAGGSELHPRKVGNQSNDNASGANPATPQEDAGSLEVLEGLSEISLETDFGSLSTGNRSGDSDKSSAWLGAPSGVSILVENHEETPLGSPEVIDQDSIEKFTASLPKETENKDDVLAMRLVTVMLDNCIPFPSRCVIDGSEKSSILIFKKSDCCIDLLACLGVKLSRMLEPDGTEEFYIEDKDKNDFLAMKLFLPDPQIWLWENANTFEEYNEEYDLDGEEEENQRNLREEEMKETERMKRFQKEVENLLKVKTYYESVSENKKDGGAKAKVGMSKIVSFGYINDIGVPVPGLFNNLDPLNMIKAPFILFDGVPSELDGSNVVVVPLNGAIMDVLTREQKTEIIGLFETLHSNLKMVHGDIKKENILIYYKQRKKLVTDLDTYTPDLKDILDHFDPSRIVYFELIDFERSEPADTESSEEELSRVHSLLKY